jgi:uncharacterized protein
MSATALKERLRADLKAAMQARATDEVRLLRTLIAALDNAEAVPREGRVNTNLPLAFGDPCGEVARRELDDAAVEALLAAEIESRRSAAVDYERHDRGDEAARLRGEAELIVRYSALHAPAAHAPSNRR